MRSFAQRKTMEAGAQRARALHVARRAKAAVLAVVAIVGLAHAAQADSRDTIIDFGDSSRAGAAYLPSSAAGQQPGAVARTPVPTAPTASPAQAYTPAPAAASSSAYPVRPAPAVAPSSLPASQYDVAPTPVNGYTVAPNSIEDYTKPGASAEPRRYYAELYTPQPLPPRLTAAPSQAPAPGQQYLAPQPARPAVSTRYGRTHPQAKRAVVNPKKGEQEEDNDASSDANDEEKPHVAPHVAIDTSIGGTTHRNGTVSTGATVAMAGHLEESGARLHLGVQGQFACCVGDFKQTTTNPGTTVSSATMVGYEMVGEKGTIAGYVGVNVENAPVGATDTSPYHRTTYVGAQVAADIYYTPTDKIMMSSNMSFSTRKYSYFMRSKLGFAVAEDLYVGPEIGAQGSKDYQQYRAGAHISGVKLGDLTFGFAAGYALDRKNGNGAYAILDSRVTF